MRLTIFSRLTLSFFTMLLIMAAVNIYTVLKLDQLNRETARISSIDERILDFRKKLADSLLSQFRYERKYAITKDPSFYAQFRSEEGDFERYLAGTVSLADTPAKRNALKQVQGDYEQYKLLVRAEIELIKRDRSYQRLRYEGEKEKLIDQILEALKTLEVSSRTDIAARMSSLREGAGTARRLAVVMLVVAFILAIGTSFLGTRSITRPLAELVGKTREISRGSFEGNLRVSSPPEVAELAKAINVMCDKLKTVDRMKSEFFSTMSHELRTPLTSIKEGIGLLQEGIGGSVTEKQKRLLSILSEETRRLIGLVNTILDLSKMEAGMMTYHFHGESLPPLIGKVFVEMAPLIETKKIQLHQDFGEGQPSVRVDRERILQAIRNLIGNAVKFTPEGGSITVSVHQNRGRVEFIVKDTGPGIPKANLTAIFEKFHQPPVKSSEWVKGTGLGLALVKHIVAAHGGEVWAESEPGQGSTFICALPL
jgi:two-component system, NtrC family, sensor histidine kinase GlrK